MTGSAVAALPSSGDQASWTAAEAALVEASGLVYKDGKNGPMKLAPRPVVEAFLQQCMRTGLDPIARQIYCIKRGAKWQTQVSIDGARLVAQRTGEYEGQPRTLWSNDGETWTPAWVATAEHPYPAFAEAGVFRTGHREPMRVVARWDSYAVFEDVWENNRKTGEKQLSSMWAKMPDLMLAKVAEMLALRKAFPQDLSGLYSTEEMQQADRTQRAPEQPVQGQVALVATPVEPSEDWFARAAEVSSKDEANALWRSIPKPERSDAIQAAIAARLQQLVEAETPAEPVQEQWAEQTPVEEPVEDWATAEVPQPDDEAADDALPGMEPPAEESNGAYGR
jgi:phage recombination protein Bet